jgi:hypothetical protein
VSGDTNGISDVFVRDLVDNTTSRVNISTSGTQADAAMNNMDGDQQTISSTGRYVVFASQATNLINGQTIATPQIYMRDTVTNTTTVVTQKSDGTLGNGSIGELGGVSSDGRFVTWSGGTNTNLHSESSPTTGSSVYIADLKNRTFRQLDSGTLQPDGVTYKRSGGNSTMSCDGSFVAFQTFTSVDPNDTDTVQDVYIFDFRNGMSAVNTSHSSTSTNSEAVLPEISCNGDFLTFRSTDDDYSSLVTTTNTDHIYLYDRVQNDISLADTSSNGVLSNDGSVFSAVDDKGNVVFASRGKHLITGRTIAYPQTYLKHKDTGLVEFITKTPSGNPTTKGAGSGLAISADGSIVSYLVGSSSSDLINSDTNGKKDIMASQTGL